MFEALETFTPKAPTGATLPDLFRNIKKHQDKEASATDKNSADKKRPLQLHGGFITAAQFAECKRIKLDTTQTTINAFFKSEVITNDDDDGKQVDTTNKMEDNKSNNKGEKLKMLFGDESDAEDSVKGESRGKKNGDGGKESEKRKHEESDKKRDHKHSKRKCEKRKSESSRTEEVSDKKQCTNETKASESIENGASGSVATVKREESINRKRPRLKKTEIGTLVVKLLTPAYAERRFDSRDTFKSTARSISHALLDKGRLEFGEILF